MTESILSFFTWCENSALGDTIRGSRWLFPAIESFHLLALAVIGGAVLLVNLRLLGFESRGNPRRNSGGTRGHGCWGASR